MDLVTPSLHSSGAFPPDEASVGAKVRGLLERFRGSPARLAFLWRALNALAELPLSDAVLWSGLSASSNQDLLELWLASARRGPRPEREDRIAEAGLEALRVAGREARTAWLDGAHLRSEEVAERLGLTRQAVNVRRQESKLLAMREGRTFLYPAWQFEGGVVLPGLERVLVELGRVSPLMAVQFLRAPRPDLGDRAPLDALRDALTLSGADQANLQDDVLRAARLFGEQGGA